MTNKEALIAVVRFSVSDNSVEKSLIDNDITGTDTYAKSNEKAIDVAAIALLTGLLSEANVSEGGYSVSYDRTAILQRINMLTTKHGLDSPLQNKIKSPSVW